MRILYKQYFILLIIYFQNWTSKNISQVSYSQYQTKGCYNTSQKLGSRFEVSSTYIIQVTYSQYQTQKLGSRFGVTTA